MDPIHTHYDNLKVSRDAPFEVIRAAYKTLCQKHHPDKNQSSDAAMLARRITLINKAYDTLSDPAKRAQHDRWIAQQERLLASGKSASASESQHGGLFSNPVQGLQPYEDVRFKETVTLKNPRQSKYWTFGTVISIAVVVALLLAKAFFPTPSTPSWAPPHSTVAATASPLQFVPFTGVLDPAPPIKKKSFDRAPDGEPWPSYSGYVGSYPVWGNRGYSTIDVDNSGNQNAVFGKLISLVAGVPLVVRHFYISGSDTLQFQTVSPGLYDLRFQNLSTGRSLKVERFRLTEKETDTGVQFTTLSLTLYTVPHGNARVTNIDDEEFNLGE